MVGIQSLGKLRWLGRLMSESGVQESLDVDACLTQDRAQRTFIHVASVAHDSDFAPSDRMPPHFLAAAQVGRRRIQAHGDAVRFPDSGSRQAAPSADAHWDHELKGARTEFGKRFRKRIAMFQARFHDLACQPLGNLDRFHNAAPLR